MDVTEGGERHPAWSRVPPGSVGALVGLVFAAALAGPWIGRGHVLLLDWVTGPYSGSVGSILGADGNTLGGSVLLLLVRALRRAAGPSISSWLPVVAWMPLVGWGVGRLMRRAGPAAAAAGAALACCNPFTLDRLAVGQIGVLWGYALLPLAVLTLTSEPRRPLAWAARAALVGAALTAASPHFFAYWLVVVVLAVPVLPMIRRRAVCTLLAVAGALAASCYLFVVRQPSATIDQSDLQAYRTRVEPPGLGVTILTLRGFWRRSGSAPARSAGSWGLVALVAAFVALGVLGAWRHREALLIGLAGLVGAVLAAGDQGPFGGPYRWAFQHIGPFRILREPQKASALLALAVAVFFGLGAARLVSLLASDRARTLGAVVLVVVPIGTAPAFLSLGSRVDVVRPSAAWREADRLVGPGPAGVLALPWHLYMPYPGTRATVANLAPTRFRAPVASGDNVELPGIPTSSIRLRSKYLEDRFRRGPDSTDFGAQIEPAGLGWVLLVKSVDWRAYQWLDQQQDLVRVLDTAELSLYKSSAPTELSAGTASYRGIHGWGVRAVAGRPVPIPEVAEGRWSASRGRVTTDVAGAPTTDSPGTTIRSRNVDEAVRGLALSGVVVVLLAIAAWGRPHPFGRRGRRRGDPAVTDG